MIEKTKKGVTLVELVICCAIIVLLGGACTAVLLSGQKVFSTSANMANTQIEANVLQSFLIGKLPSVKTMQTMTGENAKTETEGTLLYFEEDDFVIKTQGHKTIINGVSELKVSFSKAGVTDTARAEFCYVATMKDGTQFSGGLILGNAKYDVATMGVTYTLKTEGVAIAFNLPEETS